MPFAKRQGFIAAMPPAPTSNHCRRLQSLSLIPNLKSIWRASLQMYQTIILASRANPIEPRLGTISIAMCLRSRLALSGLAEMSATSPLSDEKRTSNTQVELFRF
jgi:hypothetical protein